MASRGWIALQAALALATASFATSTASALDCTKDSDCASTARTPKCLTKYGVCGCNADDQCGGPNSGMICTGTTPPQPPIGLPPFCTAGCSPVPGRNGCPSGETCSHASGGTGTCSLSCGIGLICPATGTRLNHCKGAVLGDKQCVECLSNNDCNSATGTPICNTETNICVECTDSSQCTTNTNGHLCRVPDTACGCNADSDCSAGRICNTEVHACVLGCRPGTGGDAGGSCSDGGVCVSTGGGGGTCSNQDAGTGPEDGGIGLIDGGQLDGSFGDGGGNQGDGGANGDGGNNGHNDGGNDGNYETSLEGGGCDCAITPAEDSLPVAGLLGVGGFFVFFTRRRSKKNPKS